MKAVSTSQLIKTIEENTYTNIIFDFDETIARLIIDWAHFHTYMKQLAEEYWVEKQREEMNTDGFTRFFIEKYWDDWKSKIEGVFEKTESEHYAWLEVNQLLVKFIKDNSHKYTYHILSNNMYSTLTRALKELDLQDYFVNIYWRDSVPKPKPYPDGLDEIIKKQSWSKEDFVMVWDNPNSDIAAANTTWIDSILINMYI